MTWEINIFSNYLHLYSILQAEYTKSHFSHMTLHKALLERICGINFYIAR